jgi:phosphate transport system protein
MTPPPLTPTVEELERETLGELQEVVRQLDRAVDAVIRQDHDLAGAVVADGEAIEQRCALLHVRILAMLGRCLSPSELPTVAALLHILRGVQAVGVQCTRIANLVPARAFMTSELATLLELAARAVACAVSALWLAREAFASRDVERAYETLRANAELKRRSEAIFRRASELVDPCERRAGTITAFLVISYAEAVGDIAVDIAEQAVIVVNGLFREVADRAPFANAAEELRSGHDMRSLR